MGKKAQQKRIDPCTNMEILQEKELTADSRRSLSRFNCFVFRIGKYSVLIIYSEV
jgi:hypothetical protein